MIATRAVLLTAPEASLVRDALGRECETCRGRGVQPWQPGELPGGGYCPKCNGSGLHPSPVHLVVEGEHLRYRDSVRGGTDLGWWWMTQDADELWTNKIARPDRAEFHDPESLREPKRKVRQPSRWPDGERVVLRVRCGQHGIGECPSSDFCHPLASATVQVLPVVEYLRGRLPAGPCVEVVTPSYARLWYECVPDATHDPLMHRMIDLDPPPRPGVDWIVTLSDLRST